MKKLFTLPAITALMFALQSFSPNQSLPKFAFTIDGAPFVAATVNSYTAALAYDSPTAQLTFNGEAVSGKNGQKFPTKLEIDYTFRGDALGEVNVTRVVYEYNNQKYYLQPGSAFVSITKMKWNSNRTNFTLCADIFCKVKPNYVMEEFVPVFVIRGNVQNITVTLPMSS